MTYETAADSRGWRWSEQSLGMVASWNSGSEVEKQSLSPLGGRQVTPEVGRCPNIHKQSNKNFI